MNYKFRLITYISGIISTVFMVLDLTIWCDDSLLNGIMVALLGIGIMMIGFINAACDE